MQLKNQVNLITGGCGRIGKAAAFEFARSGSHLVIADISLEKLEVLKKEILQNYEVDIKTIKCDITKQGEIKTLIQNSFEFKGFLSGAVNSAYPTSKGWGCVFEDLEEKYLREDLFAQLGSAILFSKEILGRFSGQGYGNLVHISSIQGISAPKFNHYEGTSMTSPIEYSAIKSGIISITKWLAKYYANQNIRINCISPGGILDNQPRTFLDKYRSACSNIGMLSAEEHISGTLVFLLSDLSKAINGQNIIIDDGWSL